MDGWIGRSLRSALNSIDFKLLDVLSTTAHHYLSAGTHCLSMSSHHHLS